MFDKLRRGTSQIYIALFYRNDTTLLSMPGRKDRNWFTIQGLFGTIFGLVTAATYMTGLFNQVDAPEIIIGYIPIVGSIAGVMVLFAGVSMQRVRSRKRFIIIGNTIYKSLVVLMAWIPLFVSKAVAPYLMLVCALVAFAINGFNGIAINSWFVDLIDIRIRGQYMSIRSMVSLVANILVPLIASRFIDIATDEYKALVIVFTIGWIIMWAESYSFYKITEPPVAVPKIKIKLKDVLIVPIRDKKFMGFMVLISGFYFIWYIAMSYGTLYQMNYLNLSYTFISVASIVNCLLQFVWYPIVGKIIDKYNTDLVLFFCFIFYFIDSFMWSFTNISSKFVMIIIINIIASITGPLFSLTLFKKKYDMIPEENRSLYDGFYTSIIATIIAVAPLLGNFMKDLILKNIKPFWVFEVPQFQLIFLITCIFMGILLIVNFKSAVKLLKELKQEKNKIR